MRTYYFALVVLWLCWDNNCSINPAAASVKPNLSELTKAPPPIPAAPADTMACIAALQVYPVDRPQ